jgi:hypothetical protein
MYIPIPQKLESLLKNTNIPSRITFFHPAQTPFAITSPKLQYLVPQSKFPLDIANLTKIKKVKFKRCSNACQDHKRKHQRCPIDCVGRKKELGTLLLSDDKLEKKPIENTPTLQGEFHSVKLSPESPKLPISQTGDIQTSVPPELKGLMSKFFSFNANQISQ